MHQTLLDFIWNRRNFEIAPPATPAPYTLETMRALMAALGNPQERLRAIHVAGSKGKGSTAAMLASVLRASGYRTGLYTSPHLTHLLERIQLDGVPITPDEASALVERMREPIEALGHVTAFEALTALAFLHFAERAEVAVIEVGLGGRLDATNLLVPLASVITPLALEHTAILGDTIEQIAAEKGGIIKAGVPVVTAAQPPAALATLRAIAAERGAPLTVAPEAWRVRRTGASLAGQTLDMKGPGHRHYPDLTLALLGPHQAENAALAVAALHASGLAVSEAALRVGLAGVRWPARVEILGHKPLVVVDGAHTEASARALVATLREVATWQRSTLVLGISRDKDLGALLAALAPLADRLILTQAAQPRAADPTALAAHPALQGRAPHLAATVPEAMALALADAGPEEVVVATGSLYVAAEARRWGGNAA